MIGFIGVKVALDVFAPRSSLRYWMWTAAMVIFMLVMLVDVYTRMEELILMLPLPDVRVPLAITAAAIWAGCRARSRPLRVSVAAGQAALGVLLLRELELPWSLSERLFASEPLKSVQLVVQVASGFGGLALLCKSFDEIWKESRAAWEELRVEAQRWASEEMPDDLGMRWLLERLRADAKVDSPPEQAPDPAGEVRP